MPVDNAPRLRQNDFSRGGDYSGSRLRLSNSHVSSSENVWYKNGLEAIPGAARVGAGQVSPAGQIEYIVEFRRFGAAVQTVVVSYQPSVGASTRVDRSDVGFAAAWTNITTGLTNSSIWTHTFFNDVLILASNFNVPKSWDGTTWANLAGSPPSTAYIVSSHGDFVLLAGHAGSILRYSDIADQTTWPVGNEIDMGVDSGQHIYGMVPLGEVTAVLLDHTIWILEGDTPATFARRPTRANFGTRIPNSICLTPRGLFYWSSWGPTVFDGVDSIPMGRHMKTILDQNAWSSTSEVFCAYDPIHEKLIWTYSPIGGGSTKAFFQDLHEFDPENPVFWPSSWTSIGAVGTATNTIGRNKLFLGTTDGYVLETDSGTTFNAAEYGCTVRTRYYALGPIWKDHAVRRVDLAVKAGGADITVKHAVDGGTTFTTNQTFTPDAAGELAYHEISGNGAGGAIVGRTVQFELTTATANFALHEIDEAAEDLGARGRP